jgi:hypothetical protein
MRNELGTSLVARHQEALSPVGYSPIPWGVMTHATNSPIPAQIGQAVIRWEDALAQIRQHEQRITRRPCALSDMRIDGDTLYVGSDQLQLDDNGTRRLFAAFHAPVDYICRLPSLLRERLFEFHRDASIGSPFPVDILSRDNLFCGVDRGDLHRLPSADVLHTVREAIDAKVNVEVEHLALMPHAYQIDIISPQLTREARVGDALRYGVRVRHSLLGEYATTIDGFALRLVCANGLIQRQCIGNKNTARSRPRTRRLPSAVADADRKQREQIRQLTRTAWRRLDEMASGIQKLQEREFDINQLARFLRQARVFSARLLKRLDGAWVQEGAERTAYGALNALTRVTTHDAGLSDQQRRRLELVAGVFAGQVSHLCPRCFSVVA